MCTCHSASHGRRISHLEVRVEPSEKVLVAARPAHKRHPAVRRRVVPDALELGRRAPPPHARAAAADAAPKKARARVVTRHQKSREIRDREPQHRHASRRSRWWNAFRSEPPTVSCFGGFGLSRGCGRGRASHSLSPSWISCALRGSVSAPTHLPIRVCVSRGRGRQPLTHLGDLHPLFVLHSGLRVVVRRHLAAHLDCITLHCITVQCSTVQYIAVHRSTSHCVTVHCSTL